MAPLLVNACGARKLNPVPFLLALGFAANAGSVATIIGSPQNMIVAAAARPAVPRLHARDYRAGAIRADDDLGRAGAPLPGAVDARDRGLVAGVAVPFNRNEAVKGVIVALAVLFAFIFTNIDRVHVALAAAGILLLNRSFASRDMLREVDGGLLIMLFGLFIVNAAFAATGLPDQMIQHLAHRGVDLTDSGWLFAITAVLSDIVGNTPAVILLGPYLEGMSDGIAVTLASGFSSNLIVFGSLATIIVVEAAKDRGVTISFAEFSRSGVPITAGDAGRSPSRGWCCGSDEGRCFHGICLASHGRQGCALALDQERYAACLTFGRCAVPRRGVRRRRWRDWCCGRAWLPRVSPACRVAWSRTSGGAFAPNMPLRMSPIPPP